MVGCVVGSHRIHRIHRSLLLRRNSYRFHRFTQIFTPTEFTEYRTDWQRIFSHRVHGFTQM